MRYKMTSLVWWSFKWFYGWVLGIERHRRQRATAAIHWIEHVWFHTCLDCQVVHATGSKEWLGSDCLAFMISCRHVLSMLISLSDWGLMYVIRVCWFSFDDRFALYNNMNVDRYSIKSRNNLHVAPPTQVMVEPLWRNLPWMTSLLLSLAGIGVDGSVYGRS